MTETKRANRITINNIGVGKELTGFVADFYKTHTHVMTIMSADTEFQMDTTLNSTTNRELFRKYVIDNCNKYGVDYDPVDRRTPRNSTLSTYRDAMAIRTDVGRMLCNDIARWANESKFAEHLKYDLTGSLKLPVVGVEIDEITPVSKSSKGYDLSKMGIEDGKYVKTGNWAWADIDVSITLETTNGQPIYFTVKMELVSGQLKKPETIGSSKYTKAGFIAELTVNMAELGVVLEATSKQPEVLPEETQTTDKPKRTRKPRKSKNTNKEEGKVAE